MRRTASGRLRKSSGPTRATQGSVSAVRASSSACCIVASWSAVSAPARASTTVTIFFADSPEAAAPCSLDHRPAKASRTWPVAKSSACRAHRLTMRPTGDVLSAVISCCTSGHLQRGAPSAGALLVERPPPRWPGTFLLAFTSMRQGEKFAGPSTAFLSLTSARLRSSASTCTVTPSLSVRQSQRSLWASQRTTCAELPLSSGRFERPCSTTRAPGCRLWVSSASSFSAAASPSGSANATTIAPR
mmetsp:Transcript_74854/g.196326  ORF Transcript_74854/g.196326 Transcript_74854/m.196326 type:complete len:245 (+) Transcript_74854:1433-2167(+)